MKELRPINETADMPRTDHPTPDWVRGDWYCLNGDWEFAYDPGRSGIDRGMTEQGEYPMTIRVPFCPESRLSGIGNVDFMPAVWYRRQVHFDVLPAGRALLHFGAVDYRAVIWVNGQQCGEHRGGYTPFTLDITHALHVGENVIVVYAEDDVRSCLQPHGKQCTDYRSRACSYTRTTGIWQTVWMEFVPETHLLRTKMTPHAADGCLDVTAWAKAVQSGDRLRLTAYYDGAEVGHADAAFVGEMASVRLTVDEVRLWEVGAPELYDLTLELVRGDEVVDAVDSYFALRDIALTDRALTVNGKPVFMRLILDQGFNPEGICTAPTAEYLKEDILLSMKLGFNGARFHQRIFEKRSLYYADTLGYLVWVEMPGGFSLETLDTAEGYLPEWMDVVGNHYNHPSVIGWCPLNETYHYMKMHEYTHKLLYAVTKQMDPYRPTIDASGGVHYDTDMFDTHDYEQDPAVFASHYSEMAKDDRAFFSAVPFYRGNAPVRAETYRGQPFWISEYGGTFWNPDTAGNGWGYGSAPKTETEFADRYAALTCAMLSHPRICGFCYTQLTDIEQEQNGLYRYDRTEKFDALVYEKIREANTRTAEVEK